MLKSRTLDAVELVLLVLAGLLLMTFTVTVMLDVLTRILARPILWLQEATLIAFVWGIFIGAAVAQRRGEHFVVTSLGAGAGRLRRTVTETVIGAVLLTIGLVVAHFGFINFLRGFGNQLTVTGLPLATITGAIPVFGVFVSLFTLERMVMGWRHSFPPPEHHRVGSEVTDLEGGHI